MSEWVSECVSESDFHVTVRGVTKSHNKKYNRRPWWQKVRVESQSIYLHLKVLHAGVVACTVQSEGDGAACVKYWVLGQVTAWLLQWLRKRWGSNVTTSYENLCVIYTQGVTLKKSKGKRPLGRPRRRWEDKLRLSNCESDEAQTWLLRIKTSVWYIHKVLL